jgi:ligand-binding sensor domain-containing protein
LRGKKVQIITAAILFTLIGVAAITISTIRHAQATLQAEKQKYNQAQTVAFETHVLNPSPITGIRLLSGPFTVHDAIEFKGKIYVAGSGGLMILNPKGQTERTITTADGLPAKELTSLAVLSGELWIGTNDGLIQYSRDTWRHFLPGNLEQRQITSLLATNHGDLYIGTVAGVIRYDGRTFEPFYPSQIGQTRITRIAGQTHQLYIGTFNSGLYVFESGTLHHVDRAQGLLDPMVTDLHATNRGCYVSSPQGLQFYDDGNFQTIAENLFVASFEPVTDQIWISSRDRGVIPIKTTSSVRAIRISSSASTLPSENDNAIFLKRIGDSLTAFGKNRFWVLNNGRWQLWSSPQSILSDNNVSALMRTRKGEIWVGYFDHGIDILNSDFILKTHLQDETLTFINHLSTDQDGNVYISTSNGFVILGSDGVRHVYHESDGLLSDRVMQAVPLDEHGKRVAIATSQGFTLKDGNAMKSIFAFHGLINNHVYTIAANGDQLYLGTLGGISRVRGLNVLENWTQVDSGLKRNWVNALLTMDRKLLVGTYGSGIQLRTESGDWMQFEALPQDFEVNPNALYTDGKFVFCGTLDRGFYVYDPANSIWKQFESSLPSPNVTAFAPASNSVLVGTVNGLLQISYDKLSTLPDLR